MELHTDLSIHRSIKNRETMKIPQYDQGLRAHKYPSQFTVANNNQQLFGSRLSNLNCLKILKLEPNRAEPRNCLN